MSKHNNKGKSKIYLLICHDWHPLGVSQNRSGRFEKTEKTKQLSLPETEARFLGFPAGSLCTGLYLSPP